jgi:hypothetical protein
MGSLRTFRHPYRQHYPARLALHLEGLHLWSDGRVRALTFAATDWTMSQGFLSQPVCCTLSSSASRVAM